MDRKNKELLVKNMNDVLTSSSLVLITKQSGMTVSEVSELRRNIHEVGAGYKLLKNTLLRLALFETTHSYLSSMIEGETGVAYSDDPISIAKVIVNFSKTNEKLFIVAGSLGEGMLNKLDVDELSKIASLDELHSKLIALLSVSAKNIATVMQAPARNLIGVLFAYSKKS
jgi:large subunit ribosomal protein L10